MDNPADTSSSTPSPDDRPADDPAGIDAYLAAAGRGAFDGGDPAADDTEPAAVGLLTADADGPIPDDPDADPLGPDGSGGAKVPYRKRHPILFWGAIVVVIAAIPLGITYVQALTKPGSESFLARSAEWARDMKLGFLVDRLEQQQVERTQSADGGTPEQAIGPVQTQQGPTSTDGDTATTKAQRPHLEPPAPMPSPAADPVPNEGQWFPAGPTIDGLSGVYTTKVRPNGRKTAVLVFAAWMDPKLVKIQMFPGTDLPGGQWNTPNQIPADQCNQAIIAMNGGFRMDQARGGYYAEGREAFKLRDGAASFVIKPDGTVDIGQWGRDFTRDDLPNVSSVRQNLELLVDDGKPVANINSNDWGAQLKNVYFIWRSGYGVTKDGALVYVGGPDLQPADLAQRLIDAGAVRAMEGDINPEWVTANLYSAQPDGTCKGTKGLEGSEDKGGQRQPADRYLSTDTRDFIVAFTRQP